MTAKAYIILGICLLFGQFALSQSNSTNDTNAVHADPEPTPKQPVIETPQAFDNAEGLPHVEKPDANPSELEAKSSEPGIKPAEPEIKKPAEPEVVKQSEPEAKKPAEPEVVKQSEPEAKKPAEPEVVKQSEPEMKKVAEPELAKQTEPQIKKPTEPELAKQNEPEIKKPNEAVANQEVKPVEQAAKPAEPEAKGSNKTSSPETNTTIPAVAPNTASTEPAFNSTQAINAISSPILPEQSRISNAVSFLKLYLIKLLDKIAIILEVIVSTWDFAITQIIAFYNIKYITAAIFLSFILFSLLCFADKFFNSFSRKSDITRVYKRDSLNVAQLQSRLTQATRKLESTQARLLELLGNSLSTGHIHQASEAKEASALDNSDLQEIKQKFDSDTARQTATSNAIRDINNKILKQLKFCEDTLRGKQYTHLPSFKATCLIGSGGADTSASVIVPRTASPQAEEKKVSA